MTHYQNAHYIRPTIQRQEDPLSMIYDAADAVARDSTMHSHLCHALHDNIRYPGLAQRTASLVEDLVNCWASVDPGAPRSVLQREAVAAIIDIQAVALSEKDQVPLGGQDIHLRDQITPVANRISAELDAWENRQVKSTNARYQRGRGRHTSQASQPETPVTASPNNQPSNRRYVRNKVDPTHSLDDVVAMSNKRPLVRIKEPGMEYTNHRTASLAFEDLPAAPKPTTKDFWGILASDKPEGWKEGFIGKNGVVLGDREYIALNAPHAEAMMHIAMSDKSSVLVKSGIVEFQFRKVDLVHLFKDKEDFTTTVVTYPELQKLLLDEHTLHGLAAALNAAQESSSAQLVTNIVSMINRRATKLVNRMVALDLGIKGLRIGDFRADWAELYRDHLVPMITDAGIKVERLDEEIGKYGEAVVERSIRITSLETPDPESDTFEYDQYVLKRANALLDTDLSDRALVASERISVTRLPVAAKDLGIVMDDNSSYVTAKSTPDLYNALEGIVARISNHLEARLYDAILLITSDDVRFEIIQTTELDSDNPNRPHFVLQVEKQLW